MKVYNYTVVIEIDEDGKYLTICPALQGCYSKGETKEEALEMIRDAKKLHIEDKIDNGELNLTHLPFILISSFTAALYH